MIIPYQYLTPTLPLGHEPVESLEVERLEVEWHFRIIHERNYTLSMEMFFYHALKVMGFIRSTCMSFFIYALKHGDSQDPDNRDGEQLGLIRLCGMCSAWHIPIIGITPMHLL